MRAISEGDVVDVEVIGEEWKYHNVKVAAMPVGGVWAFELPENGTIFMISSVLAFVFKRPRSERELGGQERIDSEPRVVRP